MMHLSSTMYYTDYRIGTYCIYDDNGYYRQICSLRHEGFCRLNCLKLGYIIQLDWKGFEEKFGFNRFHNEENETAK